MMTLEALIDALPSHGRWMLEKVQSTDPAKRYRAGWSDVGKCGVQNVSRYGETAKQAMERLVVEMHGPLEDLK